MAFVRSLTVLAAALFASAPAFAQDNERLKRDLLREVEKRLRAEEERLLRDIEKAIDEELGRRGGAPAPKGEAPSARKPRGFLGVRSGELTDEEKKDLGVKNGIRVVEAVPDGPAAKAGLKADDVIVGFDGRAIDSPQEIPALVQAAGPGAKVKVEYLRDGKKSTVTVTLGTHPADAEGTPAPRKEQGADEERFQDRLKRFFGKPLEGEGDFFSFDEETFEQMRGLLEQFGADPEQFFEKGKDGKYRFSGDFQELFKNFNLERFKELLPQGKADPEPAPAPRRPEPRKAAPSGPRPWLGLQPEEAGDDLRAQLDLPEGSLVIADVVPGGPAEKAGVQKNDILTRIDGKPVGGEAGLAAFMKSAKAGQEVALTLVRKSKPVTVKAVVGERKD